MTLDALRFGPTSYGKAALGGEEGTLFSTSLRQRAHGRGAMLMGTTGWRRLLNGPATALCVLEMFIKRPGRT